MKPNETPGQAYYERYHFTLPWDSLSAEDKQRYERLADPNAVTEEPTPRGSPTGEPNPGPPPRP